MWSVGCSTTTVTYCSARSMESPTSKPGRPSPPVTSACSAWYAISVGAEQYWFGKVFLGLSESSHWDDPDDRDRDFHPLKHDTCRGSGCAPPRNRPARQIAPPPPLMHWPLAGDGRQVNLRWVMVHLVEDMHATVGTQICSGKRSTARQATDHPGDPLRRARLPNSRHWTDPRTGSSRRSTSHLCGAQRPMTLATSLGTSCQMCPIERSLG